MSCGWGIYSKTTWIWLGVKVLVQILPPPCLGPGCFPMKPPGLGLKLEFQVQRLLLTYILVVLLYNWYWLDFKLHNHDSYQYLLDFLQNNQFQYRNWFGWFWYHYYQSKLSLYHQFQYWLTKQLVIMCFKGVITCFQGLNINFKVLSCILKFLSCVSKLLSCTPNMLCVL